MGAYHHIGGTRMGLDKYDSVISQSIGLRLQERLTIEQAKFVSKCRSVHRDISLNF